MALSISRRIVRSFGSLSALECRKSPSVTSRSFQASYLSGLISGDNLPRAECFSFSKGGPSFLGCRRFSSTIFRLPIQVELVLYCLPFGIVLVKLSSAYKHFRLYEDLVIPMTNFHNENKGFMVLAGDVFDLPIRKDIIHRVVLWQLAKRQQGTHSTKTISEVSGTGRKPWPQKGTGQARHGTLLFFRGGAIMHGPKPRSHAIKLNKKVRRLGLKIALSARAAEGKASHYHMACV
ncbi:hypothetical protein CRYUN_Cryun31cG0009400 [Craigia yunnanensis]